MNKFDLTKVCLIALFISIPNLISSQITSKENPNFKIIENEVIWQNTFDSNLKVDSLKTMYSNNKLSFVDVENQKQMNNRLSFQVHNTDINYKKYSEKYGSSPSVLVYPVSYYTVIDFKDYQYEITVKKITIDARSNGAGIIVFDKMITRNNVSEFTTNKYNTVYSLVLNEYFLNEFSLENNIKENDN